MRQATTPQPVRRSTFAVGLGLALLVWLASCVLLFAEEFAPWGQIDRPIIPLVSDAWDDPPVVVPVMPVDLPPIVAPQRRFVQPQHHHPTELQYPHAMMAYQEQIPRPEHPSQPAPLPGAEMLEPIPQMQDWPVPSCLDGSGCGTCGGCGGCNLCEPCVAHTRFGRFACGLYSALCCPDPCYEPRWINVANAAFFVDEARPVTQTRYRWHHASDLVYPDRAEFVWAKVGGLGPTVVPNSVTLNELSMYTEVASGGFSFFTDLPYRSYDADPGEHNAGFGDMSVGTKSVLFDSELMVITFQFRTHIPIGVSFRGLGTGHVTLEPSLLCSLFLAPETYLQGQISEWIPLGGDPGAAGAILHYHTSLNHTLFRWQPAVPIIGTFEINGWSFQAGQYTDPNLGVLSASGETYISAGPGLRVVVCDKIDFGIGSALAVTENHWGQQTIRSEFRWRF
jgi:hypothetical protein